MMFDLDEVLLQKKTYRSLDPSTRHSSSRVHTCIYTQKLAIETRSAHVLTSVALAKYQPLLSLSFSCRAYFESYNSGCGWVVFL